MAASSRWGLCALFVFGAFAFVGLTFTGTTYSAAAIPGRTIESAVSAEAGPEQPYGVQVMEAVGVPLYVKVMWLLPPPESFRPGILIADQSLRSKLEEAGAGLRLLGEYVESNHYYLVETSPLVTEAAVSRVGEVLWGSGKSLLVSVEGRTLDAAAVPGLRYRLLQPYTETLASIASLSWEEFRVPSRPPVTQLAYTESERSWIEQMVDSVSQSDIVDYLNRLTGEEAVDVGYGPDTLFTRYSYHPDCATAAEYIYSQFESMSMDVEYDYYFGLPLRAIAFVGLTGYAAGISGYLYHTEDGGDTWEKQASYTDQYLWKACAIAEDTCWISGAGGTLIATTNGGANWQSLTTGTTTYLYGVDFVNSQSGWVCGDNGLIMNTTNAGLTWSTQSSPTGQRFYDVEFTDTSNGWAVGESGKVVATSNGGQKWSTQQSGTSYRLYDVCFVDALNGWASGTGGTVIHTADGGETWETQTTGTTDYLFGVSFIDSLHGWAVGYTGIVLVTSNGGATWTQQAKPTSMPLYGVRCVDGLNGWAVGTGAAVRTSNGGTSWHSISENLPDKWRNVVATITGVTTPSEEYVVCGHYDSTSPTPLVLAPGADDNATGTALVIEAASVLCRFPLHSTVKFVCFSGEEQGLIGSTHYAASASAAGENIAGVLNFDMVGYGTPDIYLIGNSASEWLVDYCIGVRDSLLPSLALTKDIDASMRSSDHSPFWDKGYSAFCGIETDYSTNIYYHSVDDVIDNVTLSFTTDVTRLAVASLASLAGVDVANVSVPPGVPPVAGLNLGMNYPNPFNPLTTIPFVLPATARPTNYVLAIIDPAGRMVRILERGLTGNAPLGRTVVWDGTDENGRPVASGVYLSYLGCGEQDTARKIVLAR